MRANSAWGFIFLGIACFQLWVALMPPASLQALRPISLWGTPACFIVSAVIFLWPFIRRLSKGKHMGGDAEDWMPIGEAQEWLRTLFRQHGLTDEAKLAAAPMATIQMAIGVNRLRFRGRSKDELTHVNRSELLHDYPDKDHSMLYDSFAGTYLYPQPGTPQAIVMYSTKRTLFKDSTISGGVHLDKAEDTTFDRSHIKK
jgi:hypothetical protein